MDKKLVSSILFNLMMMCILIHYVDLKSSKDIIFILCILLILTTLDWIKISHNNKLIMIFGLLYIIYPIEFCALCYRAKQEMLYAFSITLIYRLFYCISKKLCKKNKVIISSIASFIISYIFINVLYPEHIISSIIQSIFFVIAINLSNIYYAKLKQYLNVKEENSTLILDNMHYLLAATWIEIIYFIYYILKIVIHGVLYGI